MKRKMLLSLSIISLGCAIMLGSCGNTNSNVSTQSATKADYTYKGIGLNKDSNGSLEVVSIGDNAEADIPETYSNMKVKTIGRSAFKMSKVQKVTIPNTVTKIEDYAFSFCRKLSNVTIKKGVTSIGKNAFAGCTNLKSVTLPKSLKTIDIFAFDGSGLTDISIPENVKSIGEYTFAECSKLTKVTFKGNKTTFEKNSFNESENVTVYASKNSTAYKTAKENNIACKIN